jgi:hypothetical protein
VLDGEEKEDTIDHPASICVSGVLFMSFSSPALSRHPTPEEREYARKLAELEALETALAERELELVTLQAELHAFERHYFNLVGMRYIELDELQAQLAEGVARLAPDDPQAKACAHDARARAQASANQTPPRAAEIFQSSPELKRLYREVARRFHPDLTTDPAEQARRHHLMADINRAYAAGDATHLQAILQTWQMGPEAVMGEGIAAELVRVIRKIAQVEARLERLEDEVMSLKSSELAHLRASVDAAADQGHDLLKEMAVRLDVEIANVRDQLARVHQSGGST